MALPHLAAPDSFERVFLELVEAEWIEYDYKRAPPCLRRSYHALCRFNRQRKGTPDGPTVCYV